MCGSIDRSGAPGPIRTADTRFRRAVLCPLSYEGVLNIVADDKRLVSCSATCVATVVGLPASAAVGASA